ncbi:MAG TPA: PEGA domain-containing protein [Polyangiales bacterium]
MTTFVRMLAQALAIALLFSVANAQAQVTAGDKARARELYTQGQQLFRQGSFTSAQRAFEDAYRAVPNPIVLLSIAECQVRNEDYSGAVASLRQYLTEKPNAPDRVQVEGQITNLEAKPGTVNIESTPPGAVIWVDEENTGYLTPNEISVRSGSHTVRLSLPGFQNAEQTINVGIGTRQRVSLSLTADAPAPVAEEPLPPPTPIEDVPVRQRHAGPAVWTAVAIAGATAIIGTGLGVGALKTKQDYDDNPTQGKIDKGEKLALFADVNFGIAIVAGVTGLVLYLTSGKAEVPPPAETAWRITPELQPNRVGMSGQMRF